MVKLTIGTTPWITAPEGVRLLNRARRPVLGLWARTAGVAVAVGLGFAALETTRADQARAVAGAPPLAHTSPAAPPTPTPPAAAPAATALFSATADARPGGFGKMAEPLPSQSFTPPPARGGTWREEEFQHASVVDGRTLEVAGRRIRLVGLDLPMPEQMCRTLDGRIEPCVRRAATQLELLTRSRRVTCVYRDEPVGDSIGRCRLGTMDLSERMVRTGYAWPAATLPHADG